MARAPKRPTTRQAGHRSNQRGTLRIDLRIPGVGRFAKATGTRSREVAALYLGMVKTLASVGRLDLIRAIRDGVLTFAEVWEEFRPQQDRPADLNRLPSAETVAKLFGERGAFLAFVRKTYREGTPHRKNMERAVRVLGRIKPAATVHDLPAVLKRYREDCVAAEHPALFNRTRSACQAFLRHTVGRYHPLYGRVAEIPVMVEVGKAGNPLTGEELGPFLTRMAELTDSQRQAGQHYAEAFRALALTGMRPAEYWGEWTHERDPKTGVAYYRIRNAKQRGGGRATYREVPALVVLQPPPVTFKALEERMRRSALRNAHTPYDGRRTFARACEEVGIPESRIKAYLGHGARTVTDLYLRHSVRPYLAEDAAKLRRYFGLTAATGPQLVRVNGNTDSSHDTDRSS